MCVGCGEYQNYGQLHLQTKFGGHTATRSGDTALEASILQS